MAAALAPPRAQRSCASWLRRSPSWLRCRGASRSSTSGNCRSTCPTRTRRSWRAVRPWLPFPLDAPKAVFDAPGGLTRQRPPLAGHYGILMTMSDSRADSGTIRKYALRSTQRAHKLCSLFTHAAVNTRCEYTVNRCEHHTQYELRRAAYQNKENDASYSAMPCVIMVCIVSPNIRRE